MPDAGLVLDYNRYMYARGNPVKYTDPTGHVPSSTIPEPLCIWCDIEIDYSDKKGATDTAVDIVATVGCFFIGCHVDREQNVITGPTPEEYVESAALDLLPIPMAAVGPEVGRALANTANAALHRLPDRLRTATIGASKKADGGIVLSVFGRTPNGTEEVVEVLRQMGYDVLDAPLMRSPATHAERQLYDAGYTEIGISRQQGMCNECIEFFRHHPEANITPYRPPE